MNIDTAVDAYMECGKAVGFFQAEMILLKFLPKNKPDGKCYDVPVNRRAKFVAVLKAAHQDMKAKS